MPLRPGLPLQGDLPRPKPQPQPQPKPGAQKRPRFRWLKWLAVTIVALILAAAVFAAAMWNHLFHDLPQLPENAALWEVGREPAIEFRARDGSLITVRGPRYGRAVTLDQLPPHVPLAFVAAEDKRFYEHEGMDSSAILRALWANWRAGETVQGGSTLTQQLVKNLVLSPEQTFKRKAQEIRLAQALERRLSKDEILTLYINRVYLGAGAYGVDAAAQTYFSKPAADLTLGEATLLAALPKAPSRLALDTNLEGARARQAYVLDQMVEAEFISAEEAAIARAEEITIANFAPDPQMGYILDMAAARVGELLPRLPSDLVVTLTIDPALQSAATEMVISAMAEQGPALAATQASALFMRPDGEVLVLIGGLDYRASQFNRVTQARRQPGSAFKAFVYAAAIEEGYDPFTVRDDALVTIDGWTPANYNQDYRGPVTLAEAYSDSLNTVAALLAEEIGQENVARLARRFGIVSPLEPVPSIALGTQEVTLMELTAAYAVFPSGGQRISPWFIARIEDTRGNILFERTPDAANPVYDPANVRMMNAMMLAVILEGTGRRAAVRGWDVAGKTGTSQDWRDAWFIGYTATLAGGVWIGNDDNSSMKKVTGGGLPAELWSGLASLVLQGEEPVPLPGADIPVSLTPDAQARILYYRNLSTAFAAVEGR